MKTAQLIVAAATATLLALPVSAEVSPAHYDNCVANLTQALGTDTRVGLAGMRASQQAQQLRLKVQSPAGERLLVTCKVDAAGELRLVDGYGVAVTPGYGQRGVQFALGSSQATATSTALSAAPLPQ